MKIGMIGFGNLGRAMTGGMLRSGLVRQDEITVCAKSEKSINEARSQFGLYAFSEINAVLQRSELIFFAVKKDVFNHISANMDLSLFKGKTVVSLMAGVSSEQICETLGCSDLVRAMPSLAVDCCEGVIGYTQTENVDLCKLFHALGYAFTVNESELEKVTAFAACGLGFAASVLEAFRLAGTELGFCDETSSRIVTQSFRYAAQCNDPRHLAARVATKGGATEQGLACLRASGLDQTISEAVHRAYEHTTAK